MKKMLSRLSVVLLLGTLLLGCGSSKEKSSKKEETGKKEVVIAGIYKAGDQVWFIDEGKAAEKKAKELGADKFIYIDAKMNPDTYLQAIDNVIAQKVDGVITCIPDQKLSKVTVDKLNEAGIPVIAADDALQDEAGNKLAPWVGINAYKIGEANGKWMADYAKENKLDTKEDAAVLLLTMDTVSSCVPRTQGEYDKFTSEIPNYPEEKIFRADYNGETDKGFNAASAIFIAHPEIKNWMIMTANEEGAVGAVRALEQVGLDKESVVIGLGAYLAKDEFKKEYSAMKAATFFSSDAVGGTSAELLMNKITKGEEIPLETAVDALVVTKDNYKEIMGKAAE